MYQAIVFLPLLGFILAAAISIVGARARFPGAEPSDDDHHHHHAAAHAAHETHIHAADAHHDDHHAPAEPAAAGSRAAEVITTSFLMISCVLSWIVFWKIGFGHTSERVTLFTWMISADLKVDWALRIDALTAVMLVVVTTVSGLVHLYSIGYMQEDPYRPRFFAYLSLFTFAMLALVTSDNLAQLFFGWEGVGLASYLLIGFWYHKPEANAAAIKAFVVNRVGDFGFALGIFALFMMTASIDLDTVFAQAPALTGKTNNFFGWHADALTLICLLLFMGAMGKSAQFLLHTWLPDAMEGPTPVSALIHAATMVTAGVFMVARLSPLFELAPNAAAVVTLVGATTAFFAATIGLVQNDIKRIVAYSTCSQLGYMFVAMGVGAYSVGMFHLFTHAFFKALLFLGSGSVIMAMHHEQDIRNMGGLRHKIPFTYWTMVIGTLALTGFPFTAGYFSKDAIIEAAYAGKNPFAIYAFLMTVVAAGLTAFYSWRLIYKTFHGTPHDRNHYEAARESPLVVLIPLGVLALGSIAAGFPFKEYFAGHHTAEFFGESLKQGDIIEAMHHAPATVVYLPTVMLALGWGIATYMYLYRTEIADNLARQHPMLYQFLLNKWYFDELYELIFTRPAIWIGRVFWKQGDGRMIDGLGPDGISARVLDVTRNVVRLQTGYLYHYAFAMLIGAAALITWFMFSGAGAH
jgi:NADH-quinone oxidoreductase subunit L